MKIKYFVFGGKSIDDSISKKIISQVSALTNLGLNVELIMVKLVNSADISYPPYNFLTIYPVNKVSTGDFIGRIKRARIICKIFRETIASLGKNDILYYRYSAPFPLYFPYQYLKGFRYCKIITEHQTKEVDELKMNGYSLSYFSELFFGKFFKKQSDAIIGVTEEITEYEITSIGDLNIPHLTLGNGFAVQSVRVRHPPNHTNNDIHLLCVANVSPWHGLDRIIRGLSTYNGKTRVFLHIAGTGAELTSLQKLAKDLGINDRMISHGFLTGKPLDALFDQCHLAVGSLGIHRIGLSEASILKVREYCARGIPFIYGISDPDFPPDFPYILRFPPDESAIDIEKVIAFTKDICGDPYHPQKMRCYAENNLDWSVKMKMFKDFLEDLDPLIRK